MSTNLALGLVNQTAGIVGENISQTLTGLSEMIGRDALNLKVNKEAAVTLSVRIKDLVAVIKEALEVQDGEALKPAWAHALASFNRVLNDTQVTLDKLHRKSHIMQLLHQKKDAEMLKELSDRVSDAFGLLKLRVNIDLATNADTIHRVLDTATKALAEIEAVPIPPSAARLPSPPQAYFGRTVETSAIVEMLSGPNQAFIAVLGSPGMGKTSVAVAALHGTEVEAKFTPHRYFIACDATDGLSSLLTALCTGLGIQFESPKSGQKALQKFLATAPCVLLLDNFESVWEAASTRQNTEDLLSSLASISTVSIIITLRGSERPAGLAWNCPLIPPLQPLQNDAAVQLFLSISDTPDDEEHLLHLLGVLGNIPLAVVLMANLAQWESLERLIAQWAEMKTAMLKRSHGADHIACLDVSIELSLASPRMQEHPHAGRLLSLLALLPAGAAELDVSVWASDIPQPAHLSSKLLQTALAYHTPENRICLLTPIQEFMLVHHSPDGPALERLFAHYAEMLDLVVHDRFFRPVTADAIQFLAPELPNIYALTLFCLHHNINLEKTLETAHNLLVVLFASGLGTFDLLPQALQVARKIKRAVSIADLTLTWGFMAEQSRAPGNAQHLFAEAQALYSDIGDKEGLIHATLALSNYTVAEDAIITCKEMCALSKDIGSGILLGLSHYTLALIYRQISLLDEAYQGYKEAAHTLCERGSGHHSLLGYIFYAMADIQADIGDIPAAVIQMEEAILLLNVSHRYQLLAEAKRFLVELILHQGNMSKAAELSKSTLVHYDKAPNPVEESMVYKSLVMIHITLAQDKDASTVVQRMQGLVVHSNAESDILMQLWYFQAKARVLHRQGMFSDTELVLHAALQVSRRAVSPFYEQRLHLESAKLLGQLGKLEHELGAYDGGSTCLITAVVIFRHIPVQYELVPALVELAQVLDDETSESLLTAVMPPLKRWNFRPSYAEALLHSARIALQRNQLQTAHHRARNALHYFEEINSVRACKHAKAFLEECG